MKTKKQHSSLSLGALKIKKKTGQEPFIFENSVLPFSLIHFWQWSQSDLVGNVIRGVLAEFIVATALDLNKGVRTEWNAVDLMTPNGLKIEIKSSAYLQRWKQDNFSEISFNIAATKDWFADKREYSHKRKRQADVYIFCLLHHREQNTVNPLDMDQWTFYVLETAVMNEKLGDQKMIRLSSLLKLKPRHCCYREIKAAIEELEGQA
jgi:hypothetical protein